MDGYIICINKLCRGEHYFLFGGTGFLLKCVFIIFDLSFFLKLFILNSI